MCVLGNVCVLGTVGVLGNVCVSGLMGVSGLMAVQVVDPQTETFEELVELEAQKEKQKMMKRNHHNLV